MIAFYLERFRDLLQAMHAVLCRLQRHRHSEPFPQLATLNKQYLNILISPVTQAAQGSAPFPGFKLLLTPQYRRHFLDDLPIQTQRYQYAQKHFANDRQRLLSYCQKNHLLSNSINELLNTKPFCYNTKGIKNSQDAIVQLDSSDFRILLIAAIVHNFMKKQDNLSQAYFFQCLEQAYLCHQISKFYRQSPSNSFICSLIRGLSFMAIQKELEQYSLENTCPESLTKAISEFIPKLDYWLAKDIGLSDELLFDIKYKYRDNDKLQFDKALLIGECGHQCIQLYQHNLLNKKELASLLHKIDHSGAILSTLREAQS